jgi:hypothetical protein
VRALTLRLLCAALFFCSGATPALASAAWQFCDHQAPLSATQQDRMLRFAAVIKAELERSGHTVALVSRNGTNLQRFGIRYSHAGVSLKAHTAGAWSVRQLYYACDERRPRLFDQGLAGFVFGSDAPTLSYVSIVLLPAAQAADLERVAMDRARALRLLAARYSANAHPYEQTYQNCNQWLVELLAVAWGALPDGEDLRARAQHWLAGRAYAPAPVMVGSHLLMFIAPFVPMIHVDDHPVEDQYALQFRTSLPASIEAFVREQLPGAQRIELCHNTQHVVVHRGWGRIADGCQPAVDDTVVALD